MVFPGRGKIIFVHGCFWHQHEGCKRASVPKSNLQFWAAKLARNVERDRAADDALAQAGWTVIRLWEHTPLADAVAVVVDAVGAPKSLR